MGYTRLGKHFSEAVEGEALHNRSEQFYSSKQAYSKRRRGGGTQDPFPLSTSIGTVSNFASQ